MKKFFPKEVIIGFLVILALAILIVGIDFLKGVNVFQKENTYYISYENVQGLTISAPVTVNGYKVGQVREIAYEYDNPGHIRVDIDIDDELRLPDGTKALLQSDLLGTASIALTLGKSSSMLKAGSQIPGEIPSGMLDKVSNDLLPAVSNVFPQVDDALSNVKLLLNNINYLVKDARGIVSEPAIRQSVKRLDALSSNLVNTTEQLNSFVGTFPPITSDIKNITGNFVNTSKDVGNLVENLNETVSSLPLDSLLTSVQMTLDNLHVLTSELNENLNNPNSTLGLLMRDPALYENINKTVQSLDSLFVDIKKNPKRYISIKLL